MLRCLGLLMWALPMGTVPAGSSTAQPKDTAVSILYLSRDAHDTARATLLDPVVADYGWQGAKFGLGEINANGQFLGQKYELIKVTVPADGDISVVAGKALSGRIDLVVADLNAADLLAVANLPAATHDIILDARTSDDSLRQNDCRNNVFHMLPNWAMRADALGQFLARKNWRRWFLLTGTAPADQAYATAIRRAASRAGAKIVAEGSFKYQADSARPQIQNQLSTVTRTSAEYDVLIAADTTDTFGDYLLFNTWAPRLVAGTHGLAAVAWHSLFKEYAARGMQYRFYLAASRDMTERDYGNWLAVSIIGTAVMRGGGPSAAGVARYLLSDEFSIPAYKGEGLSFRRWDHQLRQPLLLFGPRMLVTMWPQDVSGQAHDQTDTLGYDGRESACHFLQ